MIVAIFMIVVTYALSGSALARICSRTFFVPSKQDFV